MFFTELLQFKEFQIGIRHPHAITKQFYQVNAWLWKGTIANRATHLNDLTSTLEFQHSRLRLMHQLTGSGVANVDEKRNLAEPGAQLREDDFVNVRMDIAPAGWN